tara:strand:- start:342 stop:974 length:633 start_codon:yes stop_codon:yes gene_type:complete
MITLKLLDSNSEIASKINGAIAPEINARISKNINNIKQEMQSLINGWILSQPEIKSIQSANPISLAGQFGIRPNSVPAVVSGIVDAVTSAVFIQFKPFSNKLSGGFSVNFQPIDFSNLLSLPEGHVFYEKGDLHWMNWLLTMGSTIIVANYSYSPSMGSGRSGLGVMSIGRSFRVPPAFSGTVDNNFVTRALNGQSQYEQITKIVEKALS